MTNIKYTTATTNNCVTPELSTLKETLWTRELCKVIRLTGGQ